MIDIHTHILPMLDDGAQSVEEALDMLVMAYENGTDTVVLTPHMALPYEFNNYYDKTKYFYRDLKNIVKDTGIPVKLYLGMELLYSSKKDFISLLEHITGINKGRYLLVEFFFDCDIATIYEAVEIIQEHGYEVIIAHPERYECVQERPNKLKELKDKNVLLQMNTGSLRGKYGHSAKHCAAKLLEEDLIDVVASDAHSAKYRTPRMLNDYHYIEDLYGEKRAKRLFIETPKRIIQGEKESERT